MFAFGIALCGFAFLTSYIAGKRSLPIGLGVTLFWGYFYGILRANILSPASHFIFDGALMGCYASLLFKKQPPGYGLRTGGLSDWVMVITAWTFLVALLPFQTPLVTMVGLRGNLFFVPMMLLASRLRESEFRTVLVFIASLNIVSFGVGLAEYFMGIELFFPRSAVTQIMYQSRDVAGGNYRIPSIFSSAHAYAGSMAISSSLLLGLTGISHAPAWQRILSLLGAVSAMIGILFANTRLNVVLLVVVILGFLLAGKMRFALKSLLFVIIFGVGVLALSNERFQRFRTLEESDTVTDRLAGSVNLGILEVISEYPMGNGLGGGGTSVPHFLMNQVKNPVAAENEYARISLELGIPGLLIWLSFFIWIIQRGFKTAAKDPWSRVRRIVWVFVIANFGITVIGTGLLTAIPGTIIFLLMIGWLISKPYPDDVHLIQDTQNVSAGTVPKSPKSRAEIPDPSPGGVFRNWSHENSN